MTQILPHYIRQTTIKQFFSSTTKLNVPLLRQNTELIPLTHRFREIPF